MTTNNSWNAEYNQANGTLLIGNGTRPVVGTITAGAGISVTPGAGTITITNTGGGGGVSLSPYIVGPTNSDFTTIGAAITQAIADGASTTNQINIYVKPKNGPYVENLTLADGINIIGMDQMSATNIPPFVNSTYIATRSVRLDGNITFGNGENKVCNIQIAPSVAANAFRFNGTAGNLAFHIKNCYYDLAGATIFEFLQTSFTRLYVEESVLSSTSNLYTAPALGGGTLNVSNSSLSGDAAGSTVGAGGGMGMQFRNSSVSAHYSGAGAVSIMAFDSQIITTSGNAIINIAAASGINGTRCFVDSNSGGEWFTSANAGSTLIMRGCSLPPSMSFTAGGGYRFEQCINNSSGEVFRDLSSLSTFKGTYSQRLQGVVQTTNATATTIATIPILANECVTVHAYLAANDSTFTGGSGGQVDAVARRDAGAAISVGVFTNVFGEGTLAAATAQAVVSGNNLLIQVVGVALTTVNWSVDYTVLHTQSNA